MKQIWNWSTACNVFVCYKIYRNFQRSTVVRASSSNNWPEYWEIRAGSMMAGWPLLGLTWNVVTAIGDSTWCVLPPLTTLLPATNATHETNWISLNVTSHLYRKHLCGTQHSVLANINGSIDNSWHSSFSACCWRLCFCQFRGF